ncbi:response regulator [Paenibacillus lentus]|uniref:response regulator transcription factor n=1 Tax=Paenibacillus lentus TaxID=1338368 RepID=UPI00365D1EAA
MPRIMLVDDDVPVVEYLRKLVPWEELHLDVCAAAYSAEEARELFQTSKPDILLTDIGLPDGSGIELARQFRVWSPGLRVIFLTCHEEFQYIKEALRIDADDYIVKDELSLDNIRESIGKAMARMKSSQQELESMAYKSEIERNKDILVQRFFHDLLHACDPEAVLLQGNGLGIEWSKPCFSAALCHLDRGSLFEAYNREHLELVQYAAYNIATELAGRNGITPILANDSRLWVVANTEDRRTAQAVLGDYLPRLRSKLNEFLRTDCYFIMDDGAVSLKQLRSLVDRIKQHISEQYYAACSLVRMQGGSLPEGTGSIGDWETAAQEDAETHIKKWAAALCDSNRSQAQIYLGALEKLLEQHRPNPCKAQELFIRMLQKAVYRLNKQLEEPLQQDMKLTFRLSEAIRMIRWFTDKLLEQSKMTDEDSHAYNPDMKIINAYIHQHIHKIITSIDIARHLHLNPSYFSRYFKKISGINFTDHVHLIKMEEAKRLLAQNNETAENTAFMLGYSDRAYFSKVFKKYTSMSPSEFKQQHKLLETGRIR